MPLSSVALRIDPVSILYRAGPRGRDPPCAAGPLGAAVTLQPLVRRRSVRTHPGGTCVGPLGQHGAFLHLPFPGGTRRAPPDRGREDPGRADRPVGGVLT